ncbi:lytic transglycosylase domain-containing protein [Pseudoalteromonas pernae]|uniref:lytic transglycosylase domain-containing protein n=1 Tax=Pseudoalteromonas pernae TaxID=3118054 RepID=UPI00324254C5
MVKTMSLLLKNQATMAIILMFGSSFPLCAQTTVYHYLNEDGVAVFTDVKPKVSGFQIIKIKCDECDVELADWHRTPLHTDKYHEHLRSAALEHGIDLALLKAIVHAESGFNPKAESEKGAKGLMQLMPLLLKEFNVDDPFDPGANIAAGAAYFAELLKRFKGNSKLAAAAYNAGPSNVVHYGGVPPFRQTEAFVQRVDILRGRYRQHIDHVGLEPSQFIAIDDTLETSLTVP